LISLAIFDDIGAIIIIAIFYTENLSMAALITALVCCFLLYQFNRFNVSELPPYVLVGLVMWAALLKSGVHATLAGVIIAMFIPLRHRDPDRSPLREMERDLHAIVVFVTLPLFAFVNAGVRFVDMSMDAIWNPVTMGISAGLVIGKPLGIGLFCWLAVRLGWVKMPDSLNWTQLWSVACLCGIGFTMSLFIGNLAFESMPDRLFDERIGILIGSVISGLLGLVLLHTFVERATKETPQQATEI
jgi:NhaA family Na+:H+ antiporter